MSYSSSALGTVFSLFRCPLPQAGSLLETIGAQPNSKTFIKDFYEALSLAFLSVVPGTESKLVSSVPITVYYGQSATAAFIKLQLGPKIKPCLFSSQLSKIGSYLQDNFSELSGAVDSKNCISTLNDAVCDIENTMPSLPKAIQGRIKLNILLLPIADKTSPSGTLYVPRISSSCPLQYTYAVPSPDPMTLKNSMAAVYAIIFSDLYLRFRPPCWQRDCHFLVMTWHKKSPTLSVPMLSICAMREQDKLRKTNQHLREVTAIYLPISYVVNGHLQSAIPDPTIDLVVQKFIRSFDLSDQKGNA